MSSPINIDYWSNRWRVGQTGFHKTDLHPYMSKHVDKLIPDGKANKIFFPLCGKSVDMRWLASQGFTIIGVEGVPAPIEQFFQEQGLESVVEDMAKAGQTMKVYKSKDDQIRIYCCDIMNFTRDFEGTIDAVWDRGSIEAIDRNDVLQYVQVIKRLLSPRGRILVEVMEYDALEYPDLKGPPFSMTEKELKSLYEPECTVELVERGVYKVSGTEVCAVYYLIAKKS